ncbi:DNA polymerase III subunit delta [Beggiatoa leptomitoformis]|uniref:DNA polymerase III subunit delta n=1 Tax=Beggiatoa leptomitoformis TaxID=288004 RepID=A0A2N9YAA6_9GAMM|nr:DNA polymerase III subunit delta [Beggiatoa leptomitoformis]ALG67200.1 DNA polymerase III subunit delta [Beggiatoa leptomitoformis]AUI67393.1 DNA polymerase III subunit delta [Beggiatoa leptomitoformis]
MRIKPSQLTNHLQKQGLSAVYLITGDEPLQLMECSDLLRQFARQQGFSERVVMVVDTGFDWKNLEQEASSLSLFATRRLLEVQMGSKTPNDAGTKALSSYLANLPPDTVLLMTADKLDSQKQKTKWFTAVEEKSVIVQVFPLELAELPAWINQRLSACGLQATSDAIQMIAERSEGHLLACAQEIEKLKLLHGQGQIIDVEQVMDAVADSARFEIFDWVDTVLNGETARCVRQLQGLKAEGYDPVLILWALNKDIRLLCQVSYALQSGQRADQVFRTFRVWQQRQAIIQKATKRYSVKKWQRFLQQSVMIDRMIKGAAVGNVWDELLRLSVQISGVTL